MPDKFSATWVSHSSINDFKICPRAYYLRNVYKDPKTNNKIQLISPPLALGQIVHEVLESLSVLPTDQRFNKPLMQRFEKAWERVSGENGGFESSDQESKYKKRGEKMIIRVQENPGPLDRLAVKISEDLPYYWISEEDNIILCGKIDWLEYLPDSDSVHIIDFKTSKSAKEDDDSLQLPIYHLLVKNCQKRKVSKASYWYLDQSDELTPKELPDLERSHKEVLEIAKKIKLARKLESFNCPEGEEGCFACKPYEKILNHEAIFIGVGEYGHDLYMIKSPAKEKESVIL